MSSQYKYGAIGCSKCRYVKGVNLQNKTTKCPHCGKKLKIKDQNIFYETNNEKKLRQMIGKLNEKIKRH